MSVYVCVRVRVCACVIKDAVEGLQRDSVSLLVLPVGATLCGQSESGGLAAQSGSNAAELCSSSVMRLNNPFPWQKIAQWTCMYRHCNHQQRAARLGQDTNMVVEKGDPGWK